MKKALKSGKPTAVRECPSSGKAARAKPGEDLRCPEDARREAMGFELTPPVPAPPAPQVYTLRQRRPAPVGALLQASPARIAEGYPPQLRVVRVVTVPLPHSPILGTRDLQQVYVITCIAEPTLDSDAKSAAR